MKSFFAVAALAIASVFAEVVPNSHIILLKDAPLEGFAQWIDTAAAAHNERLPESRVAVEIREKWDVPGFKGYAGTFSPEFLDLVKSRSEVLSIEPNQIHNIIEDIPAEPTAEFPWGLGRVSHRESGSQQYVFPEQAGEGVTAYIIDTGVRITHSDFEGRAVWGFSAVANKTIDDNGHGTHVAGTVAGSKYGVARKAKIVAIKVCTGSGQCTTEGIVSGVNFAITDSAKNPKGKSVANMSLGGPKDAALDKAVANAIANGIAFAVAAGNENANACSKSPANVPEALTVGASDINDNRASFSNYGKCVDVFGPGVNILSAWNTNDQGTKSISGTSMASPHVCGVLALYASMTNETTPAELHSAAIKFATANVVKNGGVGTPTSMIFNDMVAKA